MCSVECWIIWWVWFVGHSSKNCLKVDFAKKKKHSWLTYRNLKIHCHSGNPLFTKAQKMKIHKHFLIQNNIIPVSLWLVPFYAHLQEVVLHSGPQRRELGGENIRNSSQILLEQSAIRLQPFQSLQLMDQSSELISLSRSLATFPTLRNARNLTTPRITANKVDTVPSWRMFTLSWTLWKIANPVNRHDVLYSLSVSKHR